jgi:hypothetical protein
MIDGLSVQRMIDNDYILKRILQGLNEVKKYGQVMR